MRRFNPSPYSPRVDLGNYGLTAGRTYITVVGTISKGASGKAVATLHEALKAWDSWEAADFSQGYSSDLLTNKFGSKTKEVVKTFQKAKGLGVDGVVGEKTWAALDGYPTDHVYEYSGSSSSPSSPSLNLTTSGDDATRKGIAAKESAKEKGITKQPWFWPVVAGGGVLLIGVIVLSRSGK